jgi:hypothetical protein
MEKGSLCLQFRDDVLGSIHRELIGYRSFYLSVPLNRAVDFDALFTHGYRFGSGRERAVLSVIDGCRNRAMMLITTSALYGS